MCMIHIMKKYSATYYLLSALVPYTEANMAFSFIPSAFFQELANRHKMSKNNFTTTYKRAIDTGLLAVGTDEIPRLTTKALRQLAPYSAKHLKGAALMVVFDIPEQDRAKRQQLRLTLREFKFKQIQKSVWATDVDCEVYIRDAIKELALQHHVQLFEARKINT